MTPASRQPDRLNTILLLVAVFVSFWYFARFASPDLLAIWLAGVFVRSGELSQVYPVYETVFTMYPPEAWREFANSFGYGGDLFPFIYPPLWAWLGSLLPDYTGYRFLQLAMAAINPVLLAFAIVLARRATCAGEPNSRDTLVFSLIALTFIAGTDIGLVALYQNQPQILVSFLLVLTVERLRAGREYQAGVALGLAAAIKLYPVLFVPLLLAGGNRNAVLSFMASGAILGGLSVWTTGWPLHLEFLHLISQIAETTLVSGASWNIDASIAQLFFGDDLVLVPAYGQSGAGSEQIGWYVLAKPALWSILSKIALIAAIGLTIWLTRRVSGSRQFDSVWPLALLLVSLFSPLTWSYYFLPAIIFLPAAILRFGPKVRVGLFLLLFVPISGLTASIWRSYEAVPFLNQSIAVLTLVSMAAVFICSAFAGAKSDNTKDQAGNIPA